ncbi:BTAD domain-containing putative transcriptional regulator [Kribbella sp. NPDC055071]
MRFVVLGEIGVADHEADLGHLRQRSVLAALLVEPGRPVPTEVLVDRVWSADAPRRDRETLYAYLSRLRRVLGDVLVRTSGGYQADVSPDSIDMHRFRTLRDEGTVSSLRAALDLWQGEPFAGVDTPWFADQRERLLGERFSAELDLVDRRLELGEHDQLLPDLRSRAQAHPLDERVAGQLIDALHRSGRTAEALDQYDRVRKILATELGIAPSATLRQLRQRLLETPAAGPIPRQLPAAPAMFSGRTEALDQLTAVLSTESVAAVSGTGGVGKTSLVLHWAHSKTDEFPDGQLFIDLRGFDPTDDPLPAETALTAFLHALGAPSTTIAADNQTRAGAYRTLVAGKRMLIVLDNAIDSAQVVPLLPGSPSCAVIVTSRSRLDGLLVQQSAVLVDLDVLTPTEAEQVLTRRIDPDRRTGEPEAFAELLAHCGGLPLALAIIAARAGSRPDFPLSTLAEELRESRLDALSTGELTASLRSVFATSYRGLSPDEAEVFVLMALAPGPEIGITVIAGLTDRPVPQVRSILHRLESAHLINQPAPNRYSIHDLARHYALEQHDPVLHRDAIQRLIDHYLFSALNASQLLAPNRPMQQLDPPSPGSRPLEFPDRDAAQLWLDAEHACILAGQRLAATEGLHNRVWQLAWVLNTYQNRRGHQTAQLVSWERALASVPYLSDPAVQALVLRFLGRIYGRVGRYEESLRVLHEALQYAERDGSPLVLGHSHQALAAAYERHGEYDKALRHALEHLVYYRELNPVWYADALNFTGWLYALAGRYAEGEPYCQEAVDIFLAAGDPSGEAVATDSLAYIAHHDGRYEEAAERYKHAIRLFRETGSPYYLANSLERLGHTELALGDPDAARAEWQEAVELLKPQRRQEDIERIEQNLSEL